MARQKRTPQETVVALPLDRHGLAAPPRRLCGVEHLRRWLNLSADVSVDGLCEDMALRISADNRRHVARRSRPYGVAHLRQVLNLPDVSVDELCEQAASGHALTMKRSDGTQGVLYPSHRTAAPRS